MDTFMYGTFVNTYEFTNVLAILKKVISLLGVLILPQHSFQYSVKFLQHLLTPARWGVWKKSNLKGNIMMLVLTCKYMQTLVFLLANYWTVKKVLCHRWARVEIFEGTAVNFLET